VICFMCRLLQAMENLIFRYIIPSDRPAVKDQEDECGGLVRGLILKSRR